MKKGNDVLKPGDTYENSDGVFDCISGKGNTCEGCFYEHKNCDGIECSSNAIISSNNLILVPTTTPPKLQYPIVLVPGEFVEILGVNLLVTKSPLDCESNCNGCILYNPEQLGLFCKQINCSKNSCIISNTIV